MVQGPHDVLACATESYANWKRARKKCRRGNNSISHSPDLTQFNEQLFLTLSLFLSLLYAAKTNSQIRLPLGDAHGGHQGRLHTGDASHTQEGSAAGAADARHTGYLGHVGADGTQVGTGWVRAAGSTQLKHIMNEIPLSIRQATCSPIWATMCGWATRAAIATRRTTPAWTVTTKSSGTLRSTRWANTICPRISTTYSARPATSSCTTSGTRRAPPSFGFFAPSSLPIRRKSPRCTRWHPLRIYTTWRVRYSARSFCSWTFWLWVLCAFSRCISLSI